VIQHAATGNESSVPNISLAFPSNVTAGDFLIITGTAARPRETITISDTAGNTFLPAMSEVIDPAQDVTAYIWYVTNAVGGPDTVTLNPVGGPDAMEIHISEWSGINSSSPLDQISFATGVGTQITSGIKTTTQNGELVFGYTFPNQNSSAGIGFTGLSLINGDLDEYQIQPFAGSVAATWTQSSDKWLGLMATFKPANPDSQPPSVPTNLTATPASNVSVSLSWTRSTDNVGVTAYNVYRSTTTGFIPTNGNLIGQTAGTSFTDADLPPGSFYYLVTAQDQVGNVSQPSNEASASVSGDTTPPVVSLTAPGSGATVSGTVNVTATASDDVLVAGVQFLLDGNPLGAEVTTAPYALNWASTTVANGTHTLAARARDGAGNTTASIPVTITVNNSAIPGLVGAWGFEEGTGTVAADVSGHGLSGAIANATWTSAGKFGNALTFNGTNSWVTVADNALLHLTTGMTVEAWVKPATAGTDWTAAVIKERGTTGLAYALYATDGAAKPPAGYVNKSGTDYHATAASTLSLNAWTHLAVTYDGTTIRLYVNGSQVATKAVSGIINSSAAPLRFGGDSVWGEYFNGLIDEVRVYNRALAATEVQTDMNTPVGGGGGAQLADRPAVTGRHVPALSPAQVRSALRAAIRTWAQAGVPAALLPTVQAIRVHLADLPGSGLGFTDTATDQIWLDKTAAGYGWAARRGGFDLKTVLAHEVGHLLGISDLTPGTGTPGDLMDQTIAPREVRQPSHLDVRLATSGSTDPSGLRIVMSPATADPARPPVVESDAQPPVGRLDQASPVGLAVVGGRLDQPAAAGPVAAQRSDERLDKAWWTAEPVSPDLPPDRG
jgi:hypothetical protein